MLLLKFTVDGERYELDLTQFLTSDADALLKATGWRKQEWIQELLTEHPDAIRFAYWLARKRSDRPLEMSFRDIDFDMGLLDWDAETDDADATEVVEPGPTGPSDAQGED